MNTHAPLCPVLFDLLGPYFHGPWYACLNGRIDPGLRIAGPQMPVTLVRLTVMFTAKRKETYIALHPETANGKNSTKEDGQVGHPPSFADDQANSSGQSACTSRRDASPVEQGSRLSCVI